jgi:hypothetical protein
VYDKLAHFVEEIVNEFIKATYDKLYTKTKIIFTQKTTIQWELAVPTGHFAQRKEMSVEQQQQQQHQ